MTKETFKKVFDLMLEYEKAPLPSEMYTRLVTNGFSNEEANEILNMKLIDIIGLFKFSDFLELVQD